MLAPDGGEEWATRGNPMKKLLVSVGFLVACALCALPAAAIAGGHTRHDRCFFIVAGKDATADGSVMLGYANDWDSLTWMSMRVKPAGAGGAGFLKFRTKAATSAGGVNEHQLSVIFGAETDLAPAVLQADPYAASGWGFGMWDHLLRRCTTARQAVRMLGQMAVRGFSHDAAGGLAVADPDEAWVFETLGGHHWVAVRVPDDSVWIHPNMICVRTVDLSDPEVCRGSEDLEAFAESIGRWDPAKGALDVAWAFNDRRELSAYYDKNRLWGAANLLAPSLHLSPSTAWKDLPVHVVPDRKMTVERVATVLRSHYEGTALDHSRRYRDRSPHAMDTRPICAKYTDFSTVTQLRGWLPDAIGAVAWVSESRPCSSVYVPFHASVTRLPRAWTGTRAFTVFRAVCKHLDRVKVGRSNTYRRYIPLVRSAYGGLERWESGAQRAIERRALRLDGGARRALLTSWSIGCAQRALHLGLRLVAQTR
jgi:dipeptidase